MRSAPFAALLAAAAATLSPPPPIHVAFASDLEVLPGLVVALASLANATASIGRVRVHVVSVPADAALVRDVVACALPTLAVEVHAFEAPLALPRRTRPGDERLLAPLNYARFFLGEVLGKVEGKVLYLDTDTIVHGDVAELVDAALAGGAPAVAAVPRGAGRKLRLAPSVTTDPAARAALSARGVGVNTTQRTRPQTFIDDFNAGVVVVDLAEWDARNLTAATLEWMALNLAHGLYTKGSNPPLVLAVAGDFERLDARWNCPAAPRALPLRDACVARPGIVHLTGRDKPWLGDGTLDARWAAQVPERLEACLLDAGLDSAAEAARRRAMRVRAAHRQRARFPVSDRNLYWAPWTAAGRASRRPRRRGA